MRHVEKMPETAGLIVQDLDGRPTPLASLWSDRRVVLGFLRHFG